MDYDQTLPASAGWMDQLQAYGIGSPKTEETKETDRIYHCPEVWHGDPDTYGYAYNSDLNRKSLAAIADPSRTPMIFDSSILTRSASDAGKSLPVPGRHRGRNYASYADGHTQVVGVPSPIQPADR